MTRNDRRSPTQTDIAVAAGVSTATVSRVLNDSPLVTKEVRARVEAAIERLGYFPHGAARALASRRSHTVGAIIPTLDSAIFAAGIDAFERRLQAANYTLLVTVSKYDAAAELTHLRRLLQRGTDGVLLVGNDHPEDVLAMLRRAAIPFVTSWAFDPASPHPNVGFSNASAAEAMADHLLDLGHRRIGMLAGVTLGNDRARERLEGVRRALARRNLLLDAAATQEVPYTIEAAREAVGRLTKQQHLPTGLVCGNDVIALGALFEALSRGIDVPGDLSIIGFDNLPLTRHVSPAITTVDVPAAKMGEAAAEALLQSLATGNPVESRRLDAPLLVRSSTASPRTVLKRGAGRGSSDDAG